MKLVEASAYPWSCLGLALKIKTESKSFSSPDLNTHFSTVCIDHLYHFLLHEIVLAWPHSTTREHIWQYYMRQSRKKKSFWAPVKKGSTSNALRPGSNHCAFFHLLLGHQTNKKWLHSFFFINAVQNCWKTFPINLCFI